MLSISRQKGQTLSLLEGGPCVCLCTHGGMNTRILDCFRNESRQRTQTLFKQATFGHSLDSSDNAFHRLDKAYRTPRLLSCRKKTLEARRSFPLAHLSRSSGRVAAECIWPQSTDDRVEGDLGSYAENHGTRTHPSSRNSRTRSHRPGLYFCESTQCILF